MVANSSQARGPIGNNRCMDDLDRAIIAELENDGRISNLELSRRVGLTPAPCLRRVQRLEAEGIINGYKAIVNPKAYGRGFEVTVAIDVEMNNEHSLDEFEKAVDTVAGVTEIRRLYGQPDYFLRIQVADAEAYDRDLIPKLTALPAVRRVTSHMTMRRVKG